MNSVLTAHWLGVIFHYAALALLAGFACWLAVSMLRGRPVPEKAAPSSAEQAMVIVKIAGGGLAVGGRYRFSDALSFGRAPTNDVVVNEPYVSHEHACIILQKKQYVLIDLGSRNGSTVNGIPCEKDTVLTDGDLIGIGPVSFIFKR